MQKINPFIICLSFLVFHSCDRKAKHNSLAEASEIKVRKQADTIGFVQYAWQMDSVMARISSEDKIPSNEIYKAVVCPHDDYTYAAGLYNKTLAGVKAKTIILIGVAHRAKNFELENKLIFGSFEQWESPYGGIKISPLRDALVGKLKKETFIVHDSMMQLEHSLEAITPFLQKNNKEVEIIPLLVPYITFENMELFSEDLSEALSDLMKDKGLRYGIDIAIVISNDAVHYGSEGWGGKNLAPFGTNSTGNEKARKKDLMIIEACLENELTSSKIKLFNTYTVQQDDFKEYAWVWCGRYSLPFGLLVANKLNLNVNKTNLSGTLIDWRSSLHNRHIAVKDIGMGTTAPATSKHWVAFAGISYQ
ncbi:MAG: AmmeMemoRadiSam system protein B [Ulvibacter sp.]|jgi:AmmeMemoRadiSam system protein B